MKALSPLGLHLTSFAPTLEAIAYIDHGFSFFLIPSILHLWSQGGLCDYYHSYFLRREVYDARGTSSDCIGSAGHIESMIGSHLVNSLLT